MYNPIIRLLTAPTQPIAKLLDLRSSITDLTTYTAGFENLNCSVYGGGGFISADTPNLGAGVPAIGRTLILAILHAEDAAITFTVTSFSIGGVAGTELVDRGGGTSAINTAIYSWDATELSNAANTNGSIVFDEAITSCAVGIIAVSNIAYRTPMGSGAGVSAGGSVVISVANTAAQMEQWIRKGIVIVGSTCAVNTEAPDWDFFASASLQGRKPVVLYESSSAEIAYSAAYYLMESPIFAPSNLVVTNAACTWNGAGAGDGAGIFLM